MNKANKQMAKERRAQERERETRRRKGLHILTYWGPIALAAVVVVVLIVAIATSGGSSSDGSDDDADLYEGSEEIDEESSEIIWIDTELTDDDDTELIWMDDNSDETLNTEEGLVAELGDTVNIDFTGYIDGEIFDGGHTDGYGYDLTLGSKSFISGFEEGIVGHKVGETFDLNLQFPDPYEIDDNLSGKDVVFTTTLNGIYE